MTAPAARLRDNARAAVCLLALALGMSAASASAQDHQVSIYRCTDATGALTVQNDQPCPSGQRQEVQVIDVPPPLPAYVPREQRMPDIVAVEQAERDAAILAALPEPVPPDARTAPPALFQCATWDNTRYLTEDATPAERCAPIRVVGLDGRPNAGGSACQTTRDRCEAVPEEGLCAAWQRRVDEAQFRWKFAGAVESDPKRLEFEVLAATLANSTCAAD